MALERKQQTMTQEEYDVWCFETELKTEFVDGRVVVLAENITDRLKCSFLDKVLGLYVEERELGLVVPGDFQIRPREGLRRVPDFMFMTHATATRLKDSYLPRRPDLAVEIVSPGSGRRDRIEKFAEYEAAGVGEYWILDPRKRLLQAYVLGADRRFHPLPIEHGVLRSSVVPGFFIRVEYLWQEPAPKAMDVLREMGIF